MSCRAWAGLNSLLAMFTMISFQYFTQQFFSKLLFISSCSKVKLLTTAHLTPRMLSNVRLCAINLKKSSSTSSTSDWQLHVLLVPCWDWFGTLPLLAGETSYLFERLLIGEISYLLDSLDAILWFSVSLTSFKMFTKESVRTRLLFPELLLLIEVIAEGYLPGLKIRRSF